MCTKRKKAPTQVPAAGEPRERARAVDERLQRAALELACLGLCGNFLSVWGLSHVAATIAALRDGVPWKSRGMARDAMRPTTTHEKVGHNHARARVRGRFYDSHLGT